jgi:hypothetical protein
MRPQTASRSVLACSSIALVLLASSFALADGVAPGDANATQKQQALEHFTVGKTAFEAKTYDKAITELRASLDVVNSPNARLVLARALRDSGALGDAWTEYGRVAEDATKLAATEARYSQTADAAVSERGELEPKLAFVTVDVQHAPGDTTLKVAGRSVPAEQWAAPILAPTGAVDVVLSDASGKELARQTVAATVGQKVAVTLDAHPVAPVSSAPNPDDSPDFQKAAPPPPPPQSSDRSGLRPYAYIAGGVGVAGLAAFTIFGVMSSSDFNDLKNNCPSGSCPSSKSGEINDGKTFQTVANVGLGVGIVGVAAGATLFVLSLGGKSADSTGLVVSPGYVGVRGSL